MPHADIEFLAVIHRYYPAYVPALWIDYALLLRLPIQERLGHANGRFFDRQSEMAC